VQGCPGFGLKSGLNQKILFYHEAHEAHEGHEGHEEEDFMSFMSFMVRIKPIRLQAAVIKYRII
jgi:hypothetical protein